MRRPLPPPQPAPPPEQRLKRLPAFFYRTPGGTEPAREFLKTLSSEDKVVVGKDIAKVEFGWPVGMPTCRSLGDGLWEVRSDISDGRIVRTIFFVHGERAVLLHAFIKKAQKTPKTDLELAGKRKKEVENAERARRVVI